MTDIPLRTPTIPAQRPFGKENAELQLLLIAYTFPPDNESGAARPFRFYSYLPEHGISPRVVTAALQSSARPNILYVRDAQRDVPRHTWAWHFERLARKVLFPGVEGLIWSHHAATRSCSDRGPAPPAAVLSTSPPFSTHLAALKASRALRIPWVADFRDPMTSHAATRASILRPVVILEALFVAYAQSLILNTDSLHNAFIARYPNHRDKMHVIWNGFDPGEDLSPLPIPDRAYKHLVHTGDLYGGRHPGPVLESMLRLSDSGLVSPGRLRLTLAGESTESDIPDIRVLRQLIERGMVEYVPSRIPQREARRLARQADALLLLQPHTTVQVPAKLFEYVRIGRPILAFVRPDSPSEQILFRSGTPYRAIYPSDSPANVDRTMLEFMTMPNEARSPSAWFNEQFDCRSQVRMLADILYRTVMARWRRRVH